MNFSSGVSFSFFCRAQASMTHRFDFLSAFVTAIFEESFPICRCELKQLGQISVARFVLLSVSILRRSDGKMSRQPVLGPVRVLRASCRIGQTSGRQKRSDFLELSFYNDRELRVAETN